MGQKYLNNGTVRQDMGSAVSKNPVGRNALSTLPKHRWKVLRRVGRLLDESSDDAVSASTIITSGVPYQPHQALKDLELLGLVESVKPTRIDVSARTQFDVWYRPTDDGWEVIHSRKPPNGRNYV